jgi:hypothetical protein
VDYELPLFFRGTRSLAVRPVSDNEAVLYGLGRGLGETVSAVTVGNEELLRYSGYMLRKLGDYQLPGDQSCLSEDGKFCRQGYNSVKGQGERTMCHKHPFSVMPEGFYRASRSKRAGFPLTNCGNDVSHAVFFDS